MNCHLHIICHLYVFLLFSSQDSLVPVRVLRSKNVMPAPIQHDTPVQNVTKRRRVQESEKPPKPNAKKTGKNIRRQSRMIATKINMMMPSLIKYEMVWAHIKGYPVWPGIIEGVSVKGRYLIHFFGDYSVSEVTKDKLFHFLEGFTKYSLLTSPSALLHKAVEESKLFLFDDDEKTCCCICKMLTMKANYNINYSHQ